MAMKVRRSHSFKKLAFYIGTAEVAGLIGSLFVGGIDTWYVSLIKPTFNPPMEVFGPVWIILYALMGTAAYMIWQVRGSKHHALKVYWVQLALNALWTPLFFGAHSLALSLIDILLLFVLLLETMRVFMKVRGDAVLLLLPYFMWVSFATILNISFWYLN